MKNEAKKEKGLKKKRRNDYFEMLAELSEYCGKASRMLEDIIAAYDTEKISEMSVAMHEIEHAADIAHHELVRKLSQEFITPIEREDIAALGNEIDNVIDSLEDIVLRFYIFNVGKLRPEALDFGDILRRQNEQLSLLMHDLKNFRKSTAVRDCIVEINRLEEVGDQVYYGAIRRLYTDETDAREVIKWTEIFRRMEGCCDHMEDVAQLVENVIMKNS